MSLPEDEQPSGAIRWTESMDIEILPSTMKEDQEYETIGSFAMPMNEQKVPSEGHGQHIVTGGANNNVPPAPNIEHSSSLHLHNSRLYNQRTTDVFVWGGNSFGQLGIATATQQSTSSSTFSESISTPQKLGALQEKDIVCIGAGSYHTSAVTSDGELYCWGDNTEGQCGSRQGLDPDQTNKVVAHPTRIETLDNFKIVLVACGENHTVAVSDDGTLITFGSGDFGQLGLGNAITTKTAAPKACKALRDYKITRAAAGGNHTLVLDTSGVIHVTGDSSFGALGIKTIPADNSVFSPLPLPRLWPVGVVQIATGEAHSAALTINGRVFTWGRGRAGALGLGDLLSADEPKEVRGCISRLDVKQITCGSDHTVALTSEGEVYAWGSGMFGATGLGHCDTVCAPQRVSFHYYSPMKPNAASLQINTETTTTTMTTATTTTTTTTATTSCTRIVQTSAGGRHTLFLDEENRVWVTGCNESGQCGIQMASGTENVERTARIIASPAVLPPSYFENKKVLYLVAGGEHSIAVVSSRKREFLSDTASSRPLSNQSSFDIEMADSKSHRFIPSTPPPLIPLVHQALSDPSNEHVIRELKECVERTFSNPSYLVNAFRVGGVDDKDRNSTKQKVLDSSAITEFYQNVLKLYDSGVVNVLGTSSIRLLERIDSYLADSYSKGVAHAGATSTPAPASKPIYANDGGDDVVPLLSPELAWLPPVLFISLQNPLASDPATYGSAIITRLGKIVTQTLPPTHRIPVRRAAQALLCQLPAETFAARCVRPVQRFLSHLATNGRLGAERLQAMMAGVLIDVLRQSNEDGGMIIPANEFYNKALSQALDLGAEYMAWVKYKDTSPQSLVSFCQMPFLLTPEAKSLILHGEAMMQKQQHMSAAAMQAFFQGQNPSDAGFLKISVRRTHVVEDALTALVMHADDLKKPLRVTFISGGVPEAAVDEGGVRKEFFQLLTRGLFRPEFGMFSYDESTRTHWFNLASFESENEYTMVGALLGLAIYNGVLLDAHFPLVLYKKLLGSTPTFADLVAAFPALGKGLQALLDYEPAHDVEAVFCRDFEVSYDYFGEIQKKELIPGGANIPVTGENRKQYVAAYTSWLLEDSIKTQFSAFARGFHQVCGGPALSMFSASELEIIINGLPHLDFNKLQEAAKYEGGYNPDTPQIKWFWDIVRGEFTLEQKRHFLSFTTGSDRAPVGGLGTLTLVIQRAGPDTDRLPTSHTCFNTLLLPEYSSKEKMKERLLTAVTNAQGFGLQ